MSGWFLLAAIPVFGLLVFVHEFGHFITAKWSGIRVEEFGFGFPPRIFGIKRGETIYSINWIPLGGFVRMPGENGETVDDEGNYDPRSFASKPAWRRAIVLVAGVTMNVILAFLLFGLAYASGESGYSPLVQSVCAGSPVALAGMQPGDKIISVDGQSTVLNSDVSQIVQNDINAAPKGATSVPIQITFQHANGTTQTETVGARTTDLSNTPCKNASGATIKDSQGNPINSQGPLGIVWNNSVVTTHHYPLIQIPGLAVQQAGIMLGGFADLIRSIFDGAFNVHQVAGPVGIVNFTGQAASLVPQLGWFPLLNLTAFLSLNLAIINILPFPALDGGRLALLGLEVVRRGKRLDPRHEGLIHLAGMAVLLILVVIITWNDIGTLISQR
ncbi:MAG TPA: site-2 protease family protein [Ktedonobacterales bacterium]|nr:site-2 protease family protein [Ktedonobacterales bacterium]